MKRFVEGEDQLQVLASICSIRRWILLGVKFLSRLLTALNLLPSIATRASENSSSRRHSHYKPHCQINGDKRKRYEAEQTVTLPRPRRAIGWLPRLGNGIKPPM